MNGDVLVVDVERWHFEMLSQLYLLKITADNKNEIVSSCAVIMVNYLEKLVR